MRESVIHSTEYSNFYLFDARHMYSMLIHPDLKKVHEKLSDAYPYYFKKYDYLKNHGFWGQAEPPDFETVLDESTVNEKIINTRQIVFEVTNHCNLNCTYCSFGEFYESNKSERKNMDINVAILLLNYIFDFKVKYKKRKLTISFYGGEPLLNISFIKGIVDATNRINAEKELDIEFSMTTNATLIHKHIHFLVENKFNLLISLDGNEEGQSYRTFAKSNKNSFRKVIENIDMVQRDFPAYFNSNVGFNAVLHDRNSVKSIFEFINKRYHQIPNISTLTTNDVNPVNKEMFNRMFHDREKVKMITKMKCLIFYQNFVKVLCLIKD